VAVDPGGVWMITWVGGVRVLVLQEKHPVAITEESPQIIRTTNPWVNFAIGLRCVKIRDESRRAATAHHNRGAIHISPLYWISEFIAIIRSRGDAR